MTTSSCPSGVTWSVLTQRHQDFSAMLDATNPDPSTVSERGGKKIVFVGEDCGLCKDPQWSLQRKQFPETRGSR